MKFLDLKRRLCIFGLFLVALSAIFFYFGSKPTPWEYQTWGGNSINEVEYKIKRFTQAHIGLFLLFVGSILQLINLLNGKDIKWITSLLKKSRNRF